jgi:hypothetical protein
VAWAGGIARARDWRAARAAGLLGGELIDWFVRTRRPHRAARGVRALGKHTACRGWRARQGEHGCSRAGREASSAIGLAGHEAQVSSAMWRPGSAMVGRTGEGREERGGDRKESEYKLNFLKILNRNLKNFEHESCRKFENLRLSLWIKVHLSFSLEVILI